MLPELVTLREVQGFDMRLAACEQELARVPGVIGGIDSEIETARSELQAVEEELETTAADRRHAETELEEAEANVRKYDEQLLQARTNDEYKGLQQQIANTRTRIGTIEDRILDLMERADDLEAKRQERERTFHGRKTVLEAKKSEVRSQARKQEEQREALRGRRTALLAELPDEVAAHYERICGVRHGVAVAPVRDDRCSVCNVRLRPQLFEEVRAGRKILSCESCARILFFEPDASAASSE